MKKTMIIAAAVALIASCSHGEKDATQIKDIEDTTRPKLVCLVEVADTFITYDDYKQLVAIRNAIGEVESGMDNSAVNKKSGATGFFQITPIMLKEYFNKTGIKYSLSDMKNYFKAEEVFDYMVIHECGFPINTSKVCRMWYGKGSGLRSYTACVDNLYTENVEQNG